MCINTASTIIQPTSFPPSLWQTLPEEVKSNIFDQSDLLTRLLNGKLTKYEITKYAKDIWIQVFKQDWLGDFSLLPSPTTIPTHENGIYNIRSRSMYTKVCDFVPDRDITSTENTNHFDLYFSGNFNTDGKRVVVSIRYSEDYDDYGEDEWVDEYERNGITDALDNTKSCLLHVAMRNCWLDLLEPWISVSPERMALLCLAFQHVNLLVHLVDVAKLVDLSEGFFTSSKLMRVVLSYSKAAEFGEFSMIKFLIEHDVLCSDGEGMEMVFYLLRGERLDILEYLEAYGLFEDGNNFRRNFQDVNYIGGDTVYVSFETWEWWFDRRGILDFRWVKIVPKVFAVAFAKPVVVKLDHQVSFNILKSAANFGTEAAFNLLWQYRTPPLYPRRSRWDEPGVENLEHFDSRTAMQVLVDRSLWLQLHPHKIRIMHLATRDSTLTTHTIERCSQETVDSVIREGSLHHIKVLLEVCNCPAIDWFKVLRLVVLDGNLSVVKLFHTLRPHVFSTNTMDFAASCGHLDIVCFLHEARNEGCTTAAMDLAAYHGHFDIVRFLNDHRPEGCTNEAMDSAAGRGHLNIAKYLHENRTEGCTTEAIDRAAAVGHLSVVKYLHQNRKEGCTTNAIDYASSRGFYDVVEYLYEHREEGCTVRGAVMAVINQRNDIYEKLLKFTTDKAVKEVFEKENMTIYTEIAKMAAGDEDLL
ncbi:hypothetical protein HDU76_001524 [Blyttiomyces sp. JEL0837]|nr:hypothetical protein HDU76_001524 [Blyttiomyces sp. JEL0837]